MAIYRFNVSVNNLFGEDIRRKDSGKYCGLIGVQCWCTSLMHDEVANKARGFEGLRGSVASEMNVRRVIFVHMKVFDSKHRHECYDEHPC